MKDKLDKIHKLMLANFDYKTDLETSSNIEKWTPPTKELTQLYVSALNNNVVIKEGFIGDCEDFAMLGRSIVKEVLPEADSRLVVCKDETGAGHCALSVNGWIIDNKYDTVKSNVELQNIGYKWIAIPGKDFGDDWFKLEV